MLDLFCAKLLSFSKLPFGLGSFALNVRAEIDCVWSFLRFHQLEQIRARRSSGRTPKRRRGATRG